MQATPDKPPLWRTLLILGRISNLPTVWSNCLAGWWLGSGGEGLGRLTLLCTGASFLYVGGMYLNDACDSGFDAQYRRERPIPSGAIRAQTVWLLSCAWLAIGFLLLVALGKATVLPASALLGCIVMYDVLHKKTVLSPLLMAACRIQLYPTAISATGHMVDDFEIFWCVGALGAYVIGLSCLARNESKPGRMNPWPLVLLAAPIPISIALYHYGDWPWLIASVLFAVFAGWLIYRLRGSFTKEGTTNRAVAGLFAGLALLIAPILIFNAQHRFRDLHWLLAAVLFAGWLGYCLRAFFTKEKTVGGTVAGLLAGIVFVDLLVVRGGFGFLPVVFLLLFGTALLLQRFVPAT